MDRSGWPHVTGPRYSREGEKVCDGILDWHHLYYGGPTPANIQVFFNRGNYVDAACNLLGEGKELHPETIARAEGNGWRGFIQAYQLFQHEHHWELQSSATTVWHDEEKYTGKYDQLGVLDGVDTLLDLKTGFTIPAFTGLQTAAYALALKLPQLKRRGLGLHEDGSYELSEPYSFTDYAKWRILVRAYWVTREYTNGR